MSSLISIVPWSQKLACEVLTPGDLAVDLTAGKGRDTRALVKSVGSAGQVVAFDLQAEAIEQTTKYLQAHDLQVKHWPVDHPIPVQPGIFLVQACHSTLDSVLQSPAKVIMANLGYLPGGDPSLITRPASTRSALQKSLEWLLPGGRIVVTVYPTHPGGAEEGQAVNLFFFNLPSDKWHVLSLCAANCSDAPYLIVAERLF